MESIIWIGLAVYWVVCTLVLAWLAATMLINTSSRRSRRQIDYAAWFGPFDEDDYRK